MKLQLIFTLDYEIFGDGSGSVNREQIIPTNQLLDIFDQYGAKLTLFFEYGQFLGYKKVSTEITNTSLTIITLDKEQANKSLTSKNITDVEVKSMSQEEVIKDLQNYDFGFLLRDDILLNNVASPIKFVEYISQGVMPIVSKGIGDYSALVEQYSLGIVIDIKEGFLDIDKIKSIMDDKEVHKRLYKISEDYLWENNIDINFFEDKDVVEGRKNS